MLQQQVPHVEDGAPGGLAAAADNEGDVRRDLLGREHVAVDHRVAQLGDDVHRDLVAGVVVQVRRALAALLDEAFDVILQVLAGLHALVVRLGAAEPGHHRGVPVEEVAPGLVGEAEHLAHEPDGELLAKARRTRWSAGRWRVDLGQLPMPGPSMTPSSRPPAPRWRGCAWLAPCRPGAGRTGSAAGRARRRSAPAGCCPGRRWSCPWGWCSTSGHRSSSR